MIQKPGAHPPQGHGSRLCARQTAQPTKRAQDQGPGAVVAEGIPEQT